jgi:hypothetical protein
MVIPSGRLAASRKHARRGLGAQAEVAALFNSKPIPLHKSLETGKRKRANVVGIYNLIAWKSRNAVRVARAAA